jgi:hypothetical protein
MGADQQEELSPASIEFLDESMGFVEMVTGEAAQAVVETDDLRRGSSSSQRPSRRAPETREPMETGLDHAGMIRGGQALFT